ncbi:MAG: NADH-quinone oxidoreductase subunit M [Nitrososphaerota archaeon]|nr:NADH-quinone oxidoreductase subunit M [Nitrososphaerota archaeon]MDG6941568.1 NADH-quinone oxidoreductase subunit M [Nitrososphaerota archaeon]MDG6951109.1 NADH-quinone oxidoreductase subunit M [Nitrososphaerota archaeon]
MFLPIVASFPSYILLSRSRTAGIWFTLSVVMAELLLAVYVFYFVYTGFNGLGQSGLGQYALTEQYSWVSVGAFGVSYLVGVDGLSSPLVLATALLTVFAMVGSRRLIHKSEPAYYALILLFEGAIMGVFLSLNLVLFYFFWDLVMIPMFFLIGIWGGDRRKYAAMKFMIFIFTGSMILLLALMAAYMGVTPTTFDIPSLAGKIPASIQYLPLLASFIGFGIKLPVFPLHSWLPDAYTQAPAPVAVLLAGVQSAMGGYGLIRISIGLFPQASHQWAWAFMAVGIVTMFYGAGVAILSKNLRSMFAYTSLAGMGFVVFGSFATVASGSIIGMQGAILEMFVHAFTAGSLFMLAGYIQSGLGTTDISLMNGLRSVVPRMGTLLVFACIGAMALPPFGSFVAEVLVIVGGIHATPYAAVAVLVPVMIGGYMLWMIKRAVLSPASARASGTDLHVVDAAVFALYLVPLIIMMFFSILVLGPAAPVVQHLLQLVSH